MIPSAFEKLSDASKQLLLDANSLCADRDLLYAVGLDRMAGRLAVSMRSLMKIKEMIDEAIREDTAAAARNASKMSTAVLMATLAGVELGKDDPSS